MRAVLGRLLVAAGVILLEAGMAFGQACLPPAEPYPYAPPTNDPELRAFINDEYAAYMEGIEDYMQCLDDESRRAQDEARVIFNRWIGYFGDEAVIRDRSPAQ